MLLALFLQAAVLLEVTSPAAGVHSAVPPAIAESRVPTASPGEMAALGNALFWGEAQAKDETRGLALLEQAALAGHWQASASLAQIYRWVRRDAVAALPHARVAAQAGDAGAIELLAVMLRDGIGTAVDLDGAIHWFVRGAIEDRGGQRANLVEIYVNRRPDPVKAMAWALLAGDAMSPEGRGVALGRANPEQKIAAQALVARCWASGFLNCD